MKERCIAELRGVQLETSVEDWAMVRRLAPILFDLTDCAVSEKKAAKWALTRAVSLVAQLRREARGGIE
jgi:hypothetical protein